MTMKRREMNDRRIERVVDIVTSSLSTNQVIRILLALVVTTRPGKYRTIA
jgi:hypothetical protein